MQLEKCHKNLSVSKKQLGFCLFEWFSLCTTITFTRCALILWLLRSKIGQFYSFWVILNEILFLHASHFTFDIKKDDI